METPESNAAGVCKYVVCSRLGRWRVLRDGQDAGAFADRDQAVRFACGLARDQAQAGIVGVVVVQSDVHEMHCFTPANAAAPQPPPPKFRVIGGAR
ncbi:MAG: hypothetical protein JWQ52_1740 [Phenylobacterium sp.]|jgi:hypothetical protein|nr:hypothetical protein [Phenylobacterium sp.]